MKNRSAPSATITPILIYEDVGQAIEWLCQAVARSVSVPFSLTD